MTLDVLKQQSRKFNIDLTPKVSIKDKIFIDSFIRFFQLYYASGGLIDLLVQSNVAKYCEFKLVSRLLLERNGQLENVRQKQSFFRNKLKKILLQVPSSRADIFNSNDISLIDKRLLMKVIMNCSSMSIDDLNEGEFLIHSTNNFIE